LIGDLPQLAPSMGENPQQMMKRERNMKRKVDPWLWHDFRNPAREDGLVLHHWMKEKEKDEAYPFARFNRKVEVVQYSDDEYRKAVEDNECLRGDWTRLETDHLFRLCEKYQLRFIIVADRFQIDVDEKEEQALAKAYTTGKKRENKAMTKD